MGAGSSTTNNNNRDRRDRGSYPGRRSSQYPGHRASAPPTSLHRPNRPITSVIHNPNNMRTSMPTTTTYNSPTLPYRDQTRGVASSSAQRPRPSSSSTRPTARVQISSHPSSAPSATIMSTPGAYAITQSSQMRMFRVTVPNRIRPGETFMVHAGTQVIPITCPPNCGPGAQLQISVPQNINRAVTSRGRPLLNNSGMGVLTAVDGGVVGGGAVSMNEVTRRMNEQMNLFEDSERTLNGDDSNTGNANSGATDTPSETPQPQPRAYDVRVPEHVQPGQTFPVNVEGTTMSIVCPQNVRPGSTVRINPPAHLFLNSINNSNTNNSTSTTTNTNQPATTTATDLDRPPEELNGPTIMDNSNHNNSPPPQITNQTYEVLVPPGVRPNQPFSIMAGGQQVLVTCPSNAGPGQRIRFVLPVARHQHQNRPGSNPNKTDTQNIGSSKTSSMTNTPIINYNTKDGWVRTIRITDMKFQWIRTEQGDIDHNQRFQIDKSAYVKKLKFLRGNDERLRTGELKLVPASKASTPSSLTINEDDTTSPNTSSSNSSKEILSYPQIILMQSKTFDNKSKWIQGICKNQLEYPWNKGHMRICVRRSHLLEDSMNAILSLSNDDMRKIWRFEFMGEIGVDAGGLAREWFHLITSQLMDADNGLFISSSHNQMCMTINPTSNISHSEDHLYYYRFMGRVMGKALFDRQLVSGHLVKYLYKHVLGWPVTFHDLEEVDQDLYKNLKELTQMDKEQVEYTCLDFTVTEEILGEKRVVELVEGGKDMEVNGDNLPEYLEANLKYRLMDRIKPQLSELLLGFYDVIPETLLTVLDFNELELLLCGLPNIDLKDWKDHTIYSGKCRKRKDQDQTIQWFWEIVENDFDQEMRARLLQFVTGTSGVPSRGFSVLQGNDGNIKKFMIHSIDAEPGAFPTSHTCFNRLELPIYKSKEEMYDKLKVAVTTSATGFTLE